MGQSAFVNEGKFLQLIATAVGANHFDLAKLIAIRESRAWKSRWRPCALVILHERKSCL